MQDIIDKMYEDDFRPADLSNSERRAFDAMYDQVMTMKERFDELDDIEREEEDED
jgi:hypothetical protein